MAAKIEKLNIEASQYAWLDQALKGVEFFSNLTVGQLEQVLSAIGLYGYPGGAVVFREGKKGDAMYVVFRGEVAIRKKKGWLGFYKDIARLGPGQIFGEIALLDSAPRNATAVAAQDSQLFVLLSADFDFILKENPDLARHIRRLAAERKFNLSQK